MSFTRDELFYLEKYRFCSLKQNLDSQKLIKIAFYDDSHRYSSCFFSTALGSISSLKVSLENFTILEDDSIEQPITSTVSS